MSVLLLSNIKDGWHELQIIGSPSHVLHLSVLHVLHLSSVISIKLGNRQVRHFVDLISQVTQLLSHGWQELSPITYTNFPKVQERQKVEESFPHVKQFASHNLHFLSTESP